MIKFKHKGDFEKTIEFCNRMLKREQFKFLDKYAREGVEALLNATPVDTGLTRDSWSYQIHIGIQKVKIQWYNSNTNQGIPIAILIQYGHASGNGYWVEGVDFINPALAPVFEEIAENVWKEVTK